MHTLEQTQTVANEFGVSVTTALFKDPDTGKYYLDGKKAFGSAHIAFDPVDEAIMISGIEGSELGKQRFIEIVTALAAANCPRGIVKTYIAPKDEEEAQGLVITTDKSGDFLRRGASRLMKLEVSDMKTVALKGTDTPATVIDLKTEVNPHAHDAALLGLLKQTYWDDDAELSTVKDKVDAASHLFVINDDSSGEPIAMLRAVDNDDFLYVSDSVVDMAHRNKGYATQLMNKLHEVAKAAGKAVVLVRGSDNGNKSELGYVTEARLEALYKRFGYQENEAVLFRYYKSQRVAENAKEHQAAFFEATGHIQSNSTFTHAIANP